MRELVAALLAVALVGLLEALYFLWRYLRQRRSDEIRRRLKALQDGEVRGGTVLLRPGRLAGNPLLDELLRNIPWALRLEALLEQADLSLTVLQLLSYCFGLAGFFALLGAAFAGAVAAVSLALIAFVVPLLLVLSARSRRSNKISEQLPDALEMMARALRAGHAISGSFQFVATEMPSPINIEFGRAYEEQRLGRTVEQSVVRMTGRVPNNGDLKIFAVSVIVQKETGGNLTEILENIANTIRARFRFYGKLRALTAEGRMSGMVLAALPLLMVAFLAISNPTYLNALFTTTIGNAFLAYAIGSWLLGLLWMFRLTKVEF